MTSKPDPKSLNTRFPPIKGEPIEPRYIRRAKASGWGWDASATKPKTEPRAPGPNRHDRRATVKADRLAYQSGGWVRLLGVAIRGMCRRGGFPVTSRLHDTITKARVERDADIAAGRNASFGQYVCDQLQDPGVAKAYSAALDALNAEMEQAFNQGPR